SRDQLAGRRFDFLITNPPYGKEWKNDEAAVRAEHDKGEAGRFAAGLPRISDGQMLFLQHLLARMHPAGEGESRVAIVMNGSPLFTGDAGSGDDRR
ncbi:MAG: SAM-dependent DNA methyltransferase, partial [Chloroflexi bacterium]|nr:SAM-dependent DNA methyltransferase [Chloroflexota bacterium]